MTKVLCGNWTDQHTKLHRLLRSTPKYKHQLPLPHTIGDVRIIEKLCERNLLFVNVVLRDGKPETLSNKLSMAWASERLSSTIESRTSTDIYQVSQFSHLSLSESTCARDLWWSYTPKPLCLTYNVWNDNHKFCCCGLLLWAYQLSAINGGPHRQTTCPFSQAHTQQQRLKSDNKRATNKLSGLTQSTRLRLWCRHTTWQLRWPAPRNKRKQKLIVCVCVCVLEIVRLQTSIKKTPVSRADTRLNNLPHFCAVQPHTPSIQSKSHGKARSFKYNTSKCILMQPFRAEWSRAKKQTRWPCQLKKRTALFKHAHMYTRRPGVFVGRGAGTTSIKRIETLQVDGDGVKGRPRKRWREVLREDMREKGLCREDAWDRSRWRRMLWEGHRRGWPQYTGKNNLVKINGCCCCCCWLWYNGTTSSLRYFSLSTHTHTHTHTHTWAHSHPIVAWDRFWQRSSLRLQQETSFVRTRRITICDTLLNMEICCID